MTNDFRGADIEVFEACDSEPLVSVIKPNRVRINGTEVLTLYGGKVTVDPIKLKQDVVAVSITKIICRSLAFRPRLSNQRRAAVCLPHQDVVTGDWTILDFYSTDEAIEWLTKRLAEVTDAST